MYHKIYSILLTRSFSGIGIGLSSRKEYNDPESVTGPVGS